MEKDSKVTGMEPIIDLIWSTEEVEASSLPGIPTLEMNCISSVGCCRDVFSGAVGC